MMKYKDYTATVEFDDEAGVFHGQVAGIKDVITFQGKTVAELRRAFKESVEDYLALCNEHGGCPGSL